jgi:hypothetical protein
VDWSKGFWLLIRVVSTCPCSPLKGQGVPELATQDVWVSAYLDKLLEVDDNMYRFESAMYIFTTWRDPTALGKVEANRFKAANDSMCKFVACCSK